MADEISQARLYSIVSRNFLREILIRRWLHEVEQKRAVRKSGFTGGCEDEKTSENAKGVAF